MLRLPTGDDPFRDEEDCVSATAFPAHYGDDKTAARPGKLVVEDGIKCVDLDTNRRVITGDRTKTSLAPDALPSTSFPAGKIASATKIGALADGT